MLNTPTTLRHRNQGYSLIELVVTVVLTGIVVVVLLSLFSQTQKQSSEPVFQVKAAELGQAYLEEISLKRFDENSPVGNQSRCDAASCSAVLGPETNLNPPVAETRASYDDVDDYNGLDEKPPRDAQGNLRSGFDNFNVKVTVSYAGDDLGLAVTDMKLIQVEVITPDNSRYQFGQYRGNF